MSDAGGLTPRALEDAELQALRAELESRLATVSALAANSDDVQRSVARVVLSLVDEEEFPFFRELFPCLSMCRVSPESLIVVTGSVTARCGYALESFSNRRRHALNPILPTAVKD